LSYHRIIQVVAAGANPVQITRGIDKTVKALVKELKKLSKEVREPLLLFLSRFQTRSALVF
jgi:chaperonin GroEL (HSP60 family)